MIRSNFTDPRTKSLVKTLFVLLLNYQPLHMAHAEADCGFPIDLALKDRAVVIGLENGDFRDPFLPCKSEQCRATRDLLCGYRALEYEQPAYTPQPGDHGVEFQLQQAHRNLQQFVRSHPERRQLYCNMLTKIATADDDRPPDGEARTTLWTVELAARISSRKLDCVTPVTNALPRSDAMRDLVDDERANCLAEKWSNLCARMVLPP